MSYTHIQFIAHCINTGPAIIALDNKKEYKGIDDDNTDIKYRVELVKKTITLAKENSEKGANVLKIFMMPEFFFRGKKGAYETRHIDGQPGQPGLIEQLQNLVKDPGWKDWIFVFGSIVHFSLPDGIPLPDNQQINLATNNFVASNFVLIQEGGFGTKPARLSRKIMTKVIKAPGDFIKENELKNELKGKVLTSEKVDHQLSENEYYLRGMLQELLKVNQEIQDLCAKNQLEWTKVKTTLEKVEKELKEGKKTPPEDVFPNTKLLKESKPNPNNPNLNSDHYNAKKLLQLYLPLYLPKFRENQFEIPLKDALRELTQSAKQQEINDFCVNKLYYAWNELKLSIEKSIGDRNSIAKIISTINGDNPEADIKLFYIIRLLENYHQSLINYIKSNYKKLTEEFLFRSSGELSSFTFNMKNFQFGIEVCADHGTGKLVGLMKSLSGQPLLNLHLIPSCGMIITDKHIAIQNGYVLHCDGYKFENKVINFNKRHLPAYNEPEDKINEELKVFGNKKIFDVKKKLNDDAKYSAEDMEIAYEQDIIKNSYKSHSQMLEVVNGNIVEGIERKNRVSLPSRIDLETSRNSFEVSAIFPDGAGYLHIYGVVNFPPPSNQQFANQNSIFPDSSLVGAMSNEPVLLNGMKIIFDQPVAVSPVTLEAKD